MYKRAERSVTYFSRLFFLFRLFCVHVSATLKPLGSDEKTYMKNIMHIHKPKFPTVFAQKHTYYIW